MRLIDADKLQEHFEKVKKESEKLIDIAQIIGVQAVIDSQPTAYDVDKVVEQLEIRRSLLETARITKSAKTAADTAYSLAIEDIKKGGINENK